MEKLQLTDVVFTKKESFLYLLIITIFTIFFLQADINNSLFFDGDLMHTAKSSYALFNGHIFDFYTYNKNIVLRNDYLPFIYFIFSLFNLPIYLIFGDYYQIPFFIFSLWNKLLLVIFFIFSVQVFNRILNVYTSNHKDINYLKSIYISSPLAIFSVFIFGGYDILGLFFLLLGFYYYLKKEILLFCILFGIAASFKFIPLVVFFPLLLIIEKNIPKLFYYSLIVFSFILLQVIIFSVDPAFQSQFLSFLIHLITDTSLNSVSGLNFIYLFIKVFFILFYLSICLFSYFYQYKNNNFLKYVTLISYLSFVTIFCSVKWHPQWFIYIVPFFSLLYFFINKKVTCSILEMIGYLFFVWFIFNGSGLKENVDLTMIVNGPFRDYLPNLILLGSDFYSPLLKIPAFFVFTLFLFSPLLFLFTNGKKITVFSSIFARFIFLRFLFFSLLILIPSFISLIYSST